MHFILTVFVLCLNSAFGQWCAGIPPYVAASHFDTQESCEKAAFQIKSALEDERYFVGTECVPFKIPGTEKAA